MRKKKVGLKNKKIKLTLFFNEGGFFEKKFSGKIWKYWFLTFIFEKKTNMTTIPKALVHVTTSFAVEPTEEQLLEFFKDYGYDTIEEILEEHGGGYWPEVIREWFVNTHYFEEQPGSREKNILKYDSDSEDEKVIIIEDEEWNKLKEHDIIY